jgi:hypothetical protein
MEPRIESRISCDSYNNSRFLCIGNLTTIRLNLVAGRRRARTQRPQIHQIHSDCGANARFVVAKRHLCCGRGHSFVQAAAPTGQLNVISQMSLRDRFQSTSARTSDRRAGDGSPQAHDASRCLMSGC